MVQVHTLDPQGHKEATFNDESPEGRSALAEEVDGLMRRGYTCFLHQGDEDYKIVGYDTLNNAWLTQLLPRSGANVVPVKSDGVVTGVPAMAGG